MTRDMRAGGEGLAAQVVQSTELRERVGSWISELAQQVDELWAQVQSQESDQPVTLRWPEGDGDFEEMYERLDSAVMERGILVLPDEELGNALGHSSGDGCITLNRSLSSADRC